MRPGDDPYLIPSGEEGLILDGYNILFRLAPEALDSPEEIRRLKGILEHRLEILARREALHPWVVYDGSKQARPFSRPGERARISVDPGPSGPHRSAGSGLVRISYVEPPAEADDFIHQIARQMVSRGGAVRVVTSDLRLGRRLTRVGARVVAVEALETDLLLLPQVSRAARGREDDTPADVEAHFLSLDGAVKPTALVDRRRLQTAATAQVAPAAAGLGLRGNARPQPTAGSSKRPVSKEPAGQRDRSRERRLKRGLRRQQRRLAQPARKGRRRRH